MERNNSSPKFEKSKDDKKEDGTKPARRVTHVPLGQEAQAARAHEQAQRAHHEHQEQESRATEAKEKKKKKRKKKTEGAKKATPQDSKLAAETSEKTEKAEATKESSTKPDKKAEKQADSQEAKEKPGQVEEKAETEDAEASEIVTEAKETGEATEKAEAEPKEQLLAAGAQGELPVSRRARDDFQKRMQKAAEAAAAEEPDTEPQEKTEKIREITLHETDTSVGEAATKEDTAQEQPDGPLRTASTVRSQRQGVRTGTQQASVNPGSLSTAPAQRSAAPNSSGGGGRATASLEGSGSFWPPNNPNNPNYYQQMNPNTAPASPSVAPTAPSSAEQAYSRARERRSLVAGLIVGGLVEHFRHKRREKRQEKNHKKEVSKLESEHRDNTIRHEAEKRDSERRTTALEKRLARLRSGVQEAVPTAAATFERSAEQAAEKIADNPPAEKQPAAQQEKHKGKPDESPEIRDARKKLEEVLRAEALKEETAEEQAKLPDDRRLEQSAWHRIEVDKKSGHAVEQPMVEYGEEFKHEQHQEQLHNESGADGQPAAGTAHQTQTSPGAQNRGADGSADASDTARQKQKNGKGDSRFGQGANFNASTLTDIALWIVLAIIVIAIISTLRS